MKSRTIHTHRQQHATIIPVRYRILLYTNILLVVVDLCINAFSEFLAPDKYNQLIIFIVQDVCIVLSITLLVIIILTTYIAQAGLLCLLLRMFRFPIIVSCIYLALCVVVQVLLLVHRFSDSHFVTSAFKKSEVLTFYVIQRLFSVFYYYAVKRAAYRLSDPHFYQSSKWLQNIWEKRRIAATGVTMHVASTTRYICCAIQ